jgi:hypothetical protein
MFVDYAKTLVQHFKSRLIGYLIITINSNLNPRLIIIHYYVYTILLIYS